MAPLDFVGVITLEAFRARIPSDDVAAGIQHEIGVVLRPLDQKPESLLGSLQRFIGLGQLRGALANAVFEPFVCSTQRSADKGNSKARTAVEYHTHVLVHAYKKETALWPHD